MSSRFLPLAWLMISLAAAAQSPPPQPVTSDSQALISAEFGPEFELVKNFPVLTGDFNGDGVEDAAFVATTHNGFQPGSAQFRVLDPSSSYFGLGDPKITSQFASKYPGGPRYLLIIHGAGNQGWHATAPKERFVIINLAFDHVFVGRVKRKKKVVDDIRVEETGVLNSFLVWNGRRYEWFPGASEL